MKLPWARNAPGPHFRTVCVRESYREASEDRAEIFETPFGLVLAVADGVGGRAGGGEAAEEAMRIVRKVASSVARHRNSGMWSMVVEDLDSWLEMDTAAGETTLVVASVSSHGIVGAAVGDSGAWLIGTDGYEDLTERSRKPFLGSGGSVPEPFSTRRLDGTLLLATDGLLKYTSPERICDVARGDDLGRAASELVDLVRGRSGALPDDLALILCRL